MKVEPRTIAVHLIAYGIAVAWIVPFLGVIMTGLRPRVEIIDGWWNLSQFTPSLDKFVLALTNPEFPLLRGLLNSVLVAVPATFLPLLVAALGGYGFARFSFPMKDYLFLAIVLLMAIPQQMVAIPIFRIMVQTGLRGTYLDLIILHTAWAMPWTILFLRNFVGSLPRSVEEAARVDGAGDFGVFFRIVLPMTLPALASVAVLQFMWVWNDFFFALISIFEPNRMLATQMVPALARTGQFAADPGILAAASLIVMLIPVLLFVFLQKYYIRGMVGWTVRG